jgi:hypothetical protein
LVGHDLSMRILYRFHEWLIFARVIILFMFVWPYIHSHILCTQLVICLLSHFIHIWYLDCPWSEHAHIIPISRMVDLCESYSPFHVCLTICPSAHLVYAASHLSFVTFFPYLVSWLTMIFNFCESYSPFHVCLTICPSAHLVYVNVKKRDKQSDSLLKLVQYHGFLPTHNNVTHRAGGALDHIYINKDIINNSFISTVPLHYSDHFTTTLSIPYELLL